MTKREAQLELSAILAPINAGASFSSARSSVGEFVEGIHLPFYRRKWKESTVVTTENRIRTHVLREFSDVPLARVTRELLQDFLDRKTHDGLGYAMVDHLRWDLRQIFRMAVLEGLLRTNPAELLFTPRNAGLAEKRRMGWREVALCRSVLEPRERLACDFALLAGMRPGEVFALRWDDVRDGCVRVDRRIYKGKIDTPKTRTSVRRVVLPESLQESLANWRDLCGGRPGAWIFPSETGDTPLAPGNCWRRSIAPRLKAVGLEWVNFQVMRRTHSSLMHELGVDPKLTAEQLGHGLDVQMNVYVEAGLDRRKEALRKLDEELVERGRGPRSVM